MHTPIGNYITPLNPINKTPIIVWSSLLQFNHTLIFVMENFSYNSYPDSGDSSPRSREIDFENPPPWEDQQNYKVKFMCSYGGKIHPRPHDNQLAYIGGETKILAVERNTKFSQMISKLSAICADTDVSFKYQLPGEDLDALISVTNDDDLEHMMHEYDRLYRASAKPVRMRLFLFPVACATSFGSDGSNKSDRERFVEALNSCPNQSNEKPTENTTNNNVDFLFGLEKGIGIPPIPNLAVKLPEPVAPPPPPPPPPELQADDRVVGSDHVINQADLQWQLHELQRLQIRDQQDQQQHQQQLQQQQQQLQQQAQAMYATGAGDYYVQKIPEKSPPPQVTVQPAMSAPTGFWPEKQIPGGGGYPVTTTPPPPEQQVYMIPAPTPGTMFHHQQQQPQHAPVMRQVTGQAGQGYFTNVQRMPPDVYREQQMYNVVPQQTQPPPISTAPPPVYPGMGVVRQGGSDTGYAQMAYDSGVGRQVYYTAPGGVVVPPQYQGVGVPVSGDMRPPEGKAVPTKVSQASV